MHRIIPKRDEKGEEKDSLDEAKRYHLLKWY